MGLEILLPYTLLPPWEPGFEETQVAGPVLLHCGGAATVVSAWGPTADILGGTQEIAR